MDAARITSARCSPRAHRRCSATSRTRGFTHAGLDVALLPARRRVRGPDRWPGRRACTTTTCATRSASRRCSSIWSRSPAGASSRSELAWDSRPAAQGGQRWFHLYPGERIAAGDPLHWTGPTENWNYMCADCHSTNVRKWWSDADQQLHDDVRGGGGVVRGVPRAGLAARRVGAAARRPARARQRPRDRARRARAACSGRAIRSPDQPARSRPRTTAREIEMCARCHARRGLIHEDTVHGQPVGDDYRVALLDDGLYYPDGQIRGEVYEYGSFLQSRMFAAGVTCSDCHDPHRASCARRATRSACSATPRSTRRRRTTSTTRPRPARGA